MWKARLAIAGVALFALVAVAPSAGAAPVVRQAAGADAGSITPTVDLFRADLGAPAAQRQIVWDGVPDVRAAPAFMPEGQFRGVGALFATPGVGFQVSQALAPLNFGEINPTYSTAFAPFSAPRLFTAFGSNVTDTTFVVAGTNTRAQTSGFGVVFSDVDLAGTTSIQLFDAAGASLGTFAVPAAGNSNATFSFLGVSFNAGERVALARITSGAAALATGVDDVTQGGPSDLVTMDNFIFGDPVAVPPPVVVPPPPPVLPDTTAPTVTLKGVPAAIRLKGLRNNGIPVRMTPNEPASFRVALLASVGKVRVAANELTLASRSLARAAGERSVRLRPARRLLRNTAKRFRVRVLVLATDAGGNTTTVRRTVRVRR